MVQGCCLNLMVTGLLVLAGASAAATPDARQVESYGALLLAEATLEDTLRSLRACLSYADAARLDLPAARGAAETVAAVLAQAQATLQAEAPCPDATVADLEAALPATRAAQAEARRVVELLRAALESQLGSRPRRALAVPPAPLTLADGRVLTDQLVLGALAPTQAWRGWAEGPEAWSVFRSLGFQFMSPWFGHYWPEPGTQVCDPDRVRAVADRLGSAGFPMLVWLEPEFDIDRLWPEIGEEMYLHDSAGRWQKRTRINNTINVFHPRVREELCQALERLASSQRHDPRILGYELTEESALRFDASADAAPAPELRHGGYSKAARAAFRERLRRRYGRIEALNQRWGTAYPDFEAAAPPLSLERREGEWPAGELPLLVEFQSFRAAEHAECFRQMVAALHRGNPGCLVLPQFTTALFGDPLGGVDLARMAEAGWDVLTFHTATAFAYVHSLARYQGKPVWNDEFIWTANSGRQPYLTSKSMASERELRAHAATELWRNLMWGARGFVLFNLDFAWDHPKDGGDWNNELLNGQADKRLPRYAAALFAPLLPKVRTFFPELRDGAVVDEGVMILEPTTSLYAAVPTGTVQWWGTRLLAEAQRRFYRPSFCPERYLVEGRELLSDVRVLVVPSAPYLPEDVATRLADWVSRGGVLVTLGPFASHDEYGQVRPIHAAFAADPPGAATARGAGRHITVAARRPTEPVVDAVWDAVDAAVGVRAVTATDQRLDLMLRRLPAGHLLVVLNPEPRLRVTAELRLAVPAGRVTDLSVDGGAAVPSRRLGGGWCWPVALDPGEARVFWLEAHG